MSDPLVVPGRFNGPPHSGNGGYVAGLVAARLGLPEEPVEVTLLAPPPLDRPLAVTVGEDGVTALDGDQAIARAIAVGAAPEPVEPVSYDVAEKAAVDYPGYVFHAFPTCFTCGVDREDGLAIHPGRVGDDRWAGPWTPDESLLGDLAAATWAALDCTGGWAAGFTDGVMVLGRMTALVDVLPQVGEPHVVMGQLLAVDGRKRRTATTIYDSDGRVVARSEQVWVTVDAAKFSALT